MVKMSYMFKKCPCCQYEWKTLEEFITDSHLTLHGYQANFSKPTAGFFLFNHTPIDCRSTITIPVKDFEIILEKKLQTKHFVPGLEGCPRYCTDEHNLSSCPNKSCPGNQIRNLLNIIKLRLKKVA